MIECGCMIECTVSTPSHSLRYHVMERKGLAHQKSMRSCPPGRRNGGYQFERRHKWDPTIQCTRNIFRAPANDSIIFPLHTWLQGKSDLHENTASGSQDYVSHSASPSRQRKASLWIRSFDLVQRMHQGVSVRR